MADQQTLPDLRRVGVLGLDLETRDNRLAAKKGSGWPFAEGYICGASVAYRQGGELRAHYFPIRHPDSANIDREQVFRWLRDLFASDVRIVTQNGLYDYGWLRSEADLKMPPAERMEEIGALATIVDENRYAYSLEALCDWRGLPGKDLAALKEAAAALGLPKRAKLQAHIWQFPAHLVTPYAEADAANTLALWESLDPVLDREGTRAAYRLEVDLLPMVLEMRHRGIRIDVDAAERARDHLLANRDAVFAEISEKLGANVGMAEIGRAKWLAKTFDQHSITYPRTAKGNPSFTAGNTGWMPKHPHWLPPLIVKADRYNNAAANFLQKYILDHVVNGRVHAEVHPHRSDAGGTRSLRFSYSDPPLQLMPAHDEELAPLIRGVFLPEEDEVWAKPDLSQQEFRFIVHYAARHKLTGAQHAVERYRDDPDTDFHKFVSEMTGLERQPAKNTNFAKAFGAGVRKFAAMIGKPESEARVIYETYDRALPFVKQLSQRCQNAATRTGHLTLYDGARRHWDDWEMLGVAWGKGTGPCPREEAERRIKDPEHPWYGRHALRRTSTHKAMNALIQGSAARHTKLWMRACWREGIVPMLQMHDSLDCSVSSPEQAARVAELGCAVVQLEVPMRVDVKFGRSWGDAKHTWDELHGVPNTTAAIVIVEESPPLQPAGDGAPVECTPEATMTKFTRMNARSTPPIVFCAPSLVPDPDDEYALAIQCTESPPASLFDLDELNAGLKREGVEPIGAAPPEKKPAQVFDFIVSELTPPDFGNAHSGNGRAGNGHDADYSSGEERTGRPLERYVYTNEQGEPHQRKTRSSTKKFWQETWKDGRWIKGAPTIKYLYGIHELLAAAPAVPIWIAEGEKEANTLATLKLVAVTNPGGSGKWHNDFTPEQIERWFKGRQLVYLLEDNDAPGRKHVEIIGRALHPLVADMRVVTFRDLPEKSDVTDWLVEHKHTKAELLARAQAAPKYQPPALQSVLAADVTMTAVDWLWLNRFALGKLELIVGLPDEGKGLLISYIAAQVTTGGAWPCDEGAAVLGNVLLLTAEDDPSDTVVPRLAAAGADLKRIEIIKMVREAGADRMFSLQTDLPMLRRKIEETSNVTLVLIDPISAYLGVGKVDSYRTTDVRAVLGPIVNLATELKLAIIGIMHFNKKLDITNALLRISDSLAYGATARHVYGVINDSENKRKLVVRAKNNLAINTAEQTTLAFSFGVREVGTDPNNCKTIVAPYVIWEPQYVDVSATEAMQAASENKSPGARDEAKKFLLAILANGPVAKTEIEEAAKAEGISARTLYRAKRELKNVIAKKDAADGGWTWRLCDEETI